ncbi:sigma-70 family RNA polymerase sigma factor [Pseudalkalibacillus hwajinpoensis]|uniref:sigma-70 family RNA polymerase sigma factor n=1 Tax=Guptibacillus hwajinpoensis TaxID=208199 RepID=UPI00325A5C4E
MDDYLFQHLASLYAPLMKSQIKKLHLAHDYRTYEQVALIALWESYISFDHEKGSFSAYAYVKVRGKLIDEFRKEMRLYKQQEYQSDWEKHEELYFTLHREDDVDEYMKVLTDNQKKWVQQAIVEGMSLKEIACREGVSIGAVKSWRKSTLAKLRKHIKD